MADFSQITVGSSPSLLVSQGQGPVLLFNSDASNTVWLGNDGFNVVAGDNSGTAPLPPLASVVLDGSQSIYAVTAAGQTAQVSVIPGGLNFFQLVELLVKTLIISAPAGNGLFVYSGQPVHGNPPILAVTTASADPFGNVVTAGAITDVGMPLLVYSGPPAFGNLIVSMAPAAGTDAYGNAYPEGFGVSAGNVPGSLLTGSVASSLLAGAIKASLLGFTGNVLNSNPYFSGGDLTGWSGFQGSLVATQTPAGPYPWGAQWTATTLTGGAIEGSPAPFPVTGGNQYLIAGWAYTAAGTVTIGVDWILNGSYVSTSIANLTVPANTWTPVSTVVTAPSSGVNEAYPRLGLNSPTTIGEVLIGQALIAMPQVPGGLIQAGTITAAQIAAGTITAAQIAAGTITVAQLAAGIIYAGIINGTTVNAATFTGSVFQGTDFIINSSGAFFYGGTPAAGNLVLALAQAAGSDGFGNAYIKGVTIGAAGGQQVQMLVSGLLGVLRFPSGAAFENAIALIEATVGGTSPAQYVTMEIASASTTTAGAHDQVAMLLNSAAADNSSSANLDFDYIGSSGVVHEQAYLDITGFNILAGSIVAAHPGSSPAVPESWQTITLQNGYTAGVNNGFTDVPQVRLMADNKNLQFRGTLKSPAAGFAASWGLLPTGYPNANFGGPYGKGVVANLTGATVDHVQVQNNANLSLENPAASISYDLCCIVPTQ